MVINNHLMFNKQTTLIRSEKTEPRMLRLGPEAGTQNTCFAWAPLVRLMLAPLVREEPIWKLLTALPPPSRVSGAETSRAA
jgi:hypothetical protein